MYVVLQTGDFSTSNFFPKRQVLLFPIQKDSSASESPNTAVRMTDVIFWSVKCLEKKFSLFCCFFKYQSGLFFFFPYIKAFFLGFFLFLHCFLGQKLFRTQWRKRNHIFFPVFFLNEVTKNILSSKIITQTQNTHKNDVGKKKKGGRKLKYIHETSMCVADLFIYFFTYFNARELLYLQAKTTELPNANSSCSFLVKLGAVFRSLIKFCDGASV